MRCRNHRKGFSGIRGCQQHPHSRLLSGNSATSSERGTDTMECVNDSEFLDRFLRVERPGADKILAFYDSTVDAICRNGRYLYIPLSDHLCHRGDALFESISVCDGYVFSMEGHLERLKKGCASFMQIQPPCSWEDLGQGASVTAASAFFSAAELAASAYHPLSARRRACTSWPSDSRRPARNSMRKA